MVLISDATKRTYNPYVKFDTGNYTKTSQIALRKIYGICYYKVTTI